jgi:hypothetical protein
LSATTTSSDRAPAVAAGPLPPTVPTALPCSTLPRAPTAAALILSALSAKPHLPSSSRDSAPQRSTSLSCCRSSTHRAARQVVDYLGVASSSPHHRSPSASDRPKLTPSAFRREHRNAASCFRPPSGPDVAATSFASSARTSSAHHPHRNVVRSATPSCRRAARAVFFAARAPPRRRPASGRVCPCFDLYKLHVGPTHLSDHSGDPSTTGPCYRHPFPSARAPPSWVTSSGEPPPWPTPQSSPPRRARAPSHLLDAPCRRQAGAGRAAASAATATLWPSALLLVWAGPEACSGPEPGQAGPASFGSSAQ